MGGDVASEASESVEDRQSRGNGAEDERSEDESGVDKGSMEGTERVGEFIYRSEGPNWAGSRESGRFVASDEAERFWSKVDQSGTCWLWMGGVTSDGYGRFVLTSGRIVRAHRYAYELLVGPIPDRHTVDHLVAPDGACTSTLCVRAPDHLEAVTNSENLRRRHARRRAQETDR